MHPYVWMAIGVVLSAFAQLGLRRIASFETWTTPWFIGISASIGFYGVAFIVYSYILRHWKITVAGPLMTVGVVGVVVIGGLLMGETLSLKQWAGVVAGVVAVWLLLG